MTARKNNKSNTPRVDIETITPARAKELLKNNVGNRKITDGNYEKIRRELVEGRWRLNTSAIGLSPKGKVLNGQHRLKAIADTGISAELAVMYNLPEESMQSEDTGKNRTLTQLLQIDEEANASALASLLTFMVLLDSGRMYKKAYMAQVSTPEAKEYLADHPEAREYVRHGLRLYRRINCSSPSGVAAAYWLIERAGGDAATFFDSVARPYGEPDGSAIRALASRLSTAGDRQWKAKNYAFLFLKAYNYWVVGTHVAKLHMAPRAGTEFRLPEVLVP